MGRSSHILVKLLVASLLMGTAFYLLYYYSTLFSKHKIAVFKDAISQKVTCDYFTGGWVSNPLGPAYTNTTCPIMDSYQNCLTNGRPDTAYLHWRWKPDGCELPRFDAAKFLNAMRDKSWALIGDSIFRNHLQSLVCALSQVTEVFEVPRDQTFKSRTYYFPAYNIILASIWAPFLMKADNSDTGKNLQLYLDEIDDKWTQEYPNYDYVVISGGQWFTKSSVIWENRRVVGCHNCGQANLRELGIVYPYSRALDLAYRFMLSSDHRPRIFFRTWTMSHFEHGEWYSGGICNRTLPYREGQYNGLPSDRDMREVEVEAFKKAAAIATARGIRMTLLDIYHLSVLRPDGHPGPYRHYHPFDKDKNAHPQNDCLHWCLPGPIDTWNDIIWEILMKEDGLRYAF